MINSNRFWTEGDATMTSTIVGHEEKRPQRSDVSIFSETGVFVQIATIPTGLNHCFRNVERSPSESIGFHISSNISQMSKMSKISKMSMIHQISLFCSWVNIINPHWLPRTERSASPRSHQPLRWFFHFSQRFTRVDIGEPGDL